MHGKTEGKGAPKKRARGPIGVHGGKDNDALAEMVLVHMAEDAMSAKAACRHVGISWGSFCRRVDGSEEFSDRYVRARDVLLELKAEEILEIADTPIDGVVVTTKADGGVEEKRGDMLEHRKLQIESRKWLLARLIPKKYGDKQQIEHSGSIDIAGELAQARRRSGKPG